MRSSLRKQIAFTSSSSYLGNRSSADLPLLYQIERKRQLISASDGIKIPGSTFPLRGRRTPDRKDVLSTTMGNTVENRSSHDQLLSLTNCHIANKQRNTIAMVTTTISYYNQAPYFP
ncbi:hypothetical protein CBL_09332 [Carabus blaptoides fortunei]